MHCCFDRCPASHDHVDRNKLHPGAVWCGVDGLEWRPHEYKQIPPRVGVGWSGGHVDTDTAKVCALDILRAAKITIAQGDLGRGLFAPVDGKQ